jgi:hypothetical protein
MLTIGMLIRIKARMTTKTGSEADHRYVDEDSIQEDEAISDADLWYVGEVVARKTRQVARLTLGMLMRIAARKTRQVARLILVRPPPTWDCLKVCGWHTATYLRAANSGKYILAN